MGTVLAWKSQDRRDDIRRFLKRQPWPGRAVGRPQLFRRLASWVRRGHERRGRPPTRDTINVSGRFRSYASLLPGMTLQGHDNEAGIMRIGSAVEQRACASARPGGGGASPGSCSSHAAMRLVRVYWCYVSRLRSGVCLCKLVTRRPKGEALNALHRVGTRLPPTAKTSSCPCDFAPTATRHGPCRRLHLDNDALGPLSPCPHQLPVAVEAGRPGVRQHRLLPALEPPSRTLLPPAARPPGPWTISRRAARRRPREHRDG